MRSIKRFLPWWALLISILLFAAHFFLGGGKTRLIADSHNYLMLSQGELPGAPYNSRVLTPLIALLIAVASGVSRVTAFQILTGCAFIGSLLLLKRIILIRGGSVGWQAAVVLALGCSLAATFGYTPVMADPLLLALTCCTVLALDRGRWMAALVFSILAALTKEYGLLLGVVISLMAWRRGRWKYAIAGTFLPATALLLAILRASPSGVADLQGWKAFFEAMVGYHPYLFQFRGGVAYSQLLYMWAWSVLWPVLIIASALVVTRWRSHTMMPEEQFLFALGVAVLPLLFLGDWGRGLLIIVPLACAVATAHPLANKHSFAFLIALGGLSTALARPFHSVPPPPNWFTLTMIFFSVGSSVLIAVRVLKFVASRARPQLEVGMKSSPREVALP